MDRLASLEIARDQLILSILVRGVFSAGAGSFETRIVGISKGPWSIGEEEINAVDKPRAAWGLEMIATQNLAVALDSALEDSVTNRLTHPASDLCEYFCFVRCLRNSFAHDPYDPTWELKNENYRRIYRLPNSWDVDLTSRNGTRVNAEDYRYAGGLIRLLEFGLPMIR